MNPPRFDQLRALVAFADSGSCKGAAQIVARSEAAVSVQLRKLEDDLGRALFAKIGRRLMLTEFGASVVSDARRILTICEDIRIRATQAEVPACLRIGAPDDYLTLVQDLLAMIRETFPATRLELNCLPSQQLRPLLLAGKLDLALLSCADEHEPGLFIRRADVVWAMAGQAAIDRADPLPLALFPDGCIMRKRALEALDRIGRRYEIAYTSSNIEALRGIVAQGLAVAPFVDMDLPAGFRTQTAELPALNDITVMLQFAPGAAADWQAALSAAMARKPLVQGRAEAAR
ncbi:LysR substrate-binding domain-containing protein [Paracoccus aminophilus]|uniref:Transcriptional regulator, LysR family n=1 Tax=Paracoccus aminophilus JCM 7686 TaxID=1367847 RepID=S5XNN0_PARAH|nr:LysR substrate-binding domain-containing protein [Paracoccus aminophilus]AGT08939.1 transcriptional regulator, LysR family [Paracoccus aminophilus JCM 7686]